MPQLRFREEESSSRGLLFLAAGALAGLAAGLIITERLGGMGGLTRRVRQSLGRATEELIGSTIPYEEDDFDETDYEPSPEEELEERVLEAFRNDPVLSERAVDIGAIGNGIIELTGWVHEPDESQHAVTITRGTPGVETVVNRLTVRDEDERLQHLAEDYSAEETHEGHWEGQGVGTGRRRQGTSQEEDRHDDPAPLLKERALRESQALRSAADDLPVAERRVSEAAETDSGVPRGDHVSDPMGDEQR